VRRIALVRLRDGETVPFEQQRIRDAIERALLAAGTEDRALAEEIASVVELFLEKTFFDDVPSTTQVEDMVEKVLMDTGHAAAAKAFILHRDRRLRLREAREAREARFQPTLFDHRVVVVDDAAEGRSAAFSRERLARTLAADGTVKRAVADDVAAGVETRLREAGVARAPASLVRSLAEVELLLRDVPLDLRRRGGAVLSAESLAAALYRKGTGGPAAPGGAPFPAVAATELGGAALRSHALGELLPAAVARAHLDGDVHVHGLDLPAALHSAALRPADVAAGTAPGAAARSPRDAAGSARRLTASLGRASRFLGAAVTDGVAVVELPGAYAPLLVEADREAISEEAWHLLLETSADVGGRRLALDLTPVLPGGGDEAPDRASAAAAAFSAAVLRAHARREGLPPAELLPIPTVTVSDRALESAEARDVLRLAAEAVLRGSCVVFPLERGAPAREERRAAAPPVDGRRICAGRVTLNLARLARRVGRDHVEGFLRACDRLVDLAAEGHVARRELLAQVAAASGGCLAPLLRGPRGRPPLYDLSTASWSFGITGLNEAVQLLSGFELHDGDETVARLARRIVSYLALRVKAAGAAGDFAATLDADEDPDVAARLFAADRRDAPGAMSELFPDRDAYTPGVTVRADAPVDLLARVEHEEPLHANLSGATLRLRLPAKEAGGPDGIVALLRKLLRAGSAVRVEVTTW
jgi:ribonucleoside-triphosphate reductase